MLTKIQNSKIFKRGFILITWPFNNNKTSTNGNNCKDRELQALYQAIIVTYKITIECKITPFLLKTNSNLSTLNTKRKIKERNTLATPSNKEKKFNNSIIRLKRNSKKRATMIKRLTQRQDEI